MLVVEDDSAVQRLIATILRREKLEVFTANDGLDAVQCLQTTRFDLVVLDLMMPRMDGFALLEHLREGTSVRHDGPVIVMTAAADTLVSRLDGTQVQAVLRKPFEVDQLALLVRRTLEEKEQP
ncbi:MAG TPA: response regulator [Thermoanaerobaculia bacterium]